MATYYVKASGTSDWPFDSEATAASNLDVLFAALTAHSASLSSADTVQVRGEVVGTSEDLYDFSGAVMTGLDSRNDRLVLSSSYLQNGLVLNLNVALISPDNEYVLWECPEVSKCRIGYENPGVEESSVVLVGWGTSNALDKIITNNYLYCTNRQSGDLITTILADIKGSHSSSDVRIEDNTFVACDGMAISCPGSPVTRRKLYIRNNVITGVSQDVWDFSNLTADIEHIANCFTIQPVDQDSVPIELHPSEVVADPLFAGSGDEPYRLQLTSPAHHTGYQFSETPLTDLVGITRGYPLNMGCFEDVPRIPRTFYVNAGAMTTDGLTPETGYHKVSDLQQNITLIDDDVIAIVDNGVVDDAIIGEVIFRTSITIVKYYGSANIPTWKISSGEGVFFTSSGKIVHIYEIHFLSDSFGKVIFDSSLTIPDCEVSRCLFDNVQLYVHEILS